MVGSMFGNGSHYNPNEPRDPHGRWTGGGSGSSAAKAKLLRFGYGWDAPLPDVSAAGRATSLLVYVSTQLKRAYDFPDVTRTMGKRFAPVLAAWNADSRLNDDAFFDRYVGFSAGYDAVDDFRRAAAMAAQATTFNEMADAAEFFAAAVRTIGSRYPWPPVRNRLEERANDAIYQGKVVLAAQNVGYSVPSAASAAALFGPASSANFAVLARWAAVVAGYATADAPGVAAGLLIIPVATRNFAEREVFGYPRVIYRYDPDERQRALVMEQDSSLQKVCWPCGSDNIFRDTSGRPIARHVKDSIVIDPKALAVAAAASASAGAGPWPNSPRPKFQLAQATFGHGSRHADVPGLEDAISAALPVSLPFGVFGKGAIFYGGSIYEFHYYGLGAGVTVGTYWEIGE